MVEIKNVQSGKRYHGIIKILGTKTVQQGSSNTMMMAKYEGGGGI